MITEEFARHSEIRNGELIRYYGSETDVTVPDDVTIIAAGAFRACRKLTNVTLGKRVAAIHDDAFADCQRLRQISFPAGLREIGERAFAKCSSLTGISLPKTVFHIFKTVDQT